MTAVHPSTFVKFLAPPGLMLVIEAACRRGWVDPIVFPAPSAILNALVSLLQRWDMWVSLSVTVIAVLSSFSLAVILGTGVGVYLAESRTAGAILQPFVNFSFGIPKSIFLPIFILIFGIGIGQKIAFAKFTTMFILMNGASMAIKAVGPELRLVARALNANAWQVFREIYVPAMAPVLLESARLGLTVNITAILLAEMYAAKDGLGYRMAGWGEAQNMPYLFAGLVLCTTLAILANESIARMEYRIGKWR